MLEDGNLKKFRIFKLNSLLRHLQLGEEHLKKCLTEAQLHQLYQDLPMPAAQRKKLKLDKASKFGNAMMILNGVIAGIMGSYVGIASVLIGLNAFSSALFLPLLISGIIIGAYLGYYYYRTHLREEKNSIFQQKFMNIQKKILRIIKNKMEKNTKKSTAIINEYLQKLQTTLNAPKDNNNIFFDFDNIHWLSEFKNLLQPKSDKIQIRQIVKQIEVIITQSPWHASHQPKPARSAETHAYSYLDILTNTRISSPKESVKRPPWWKGKIKKLGAEFLPLLFGTLGVVGLYFGAIPDMAQQVGIPIVKTILVNPTARKLELIFGLLITLYLGYTQINNFRKQRIRSIENQATATQIFNLETDISQQFAKLSSLRQLKAKMTNLLLILKLTKVNASL